MAYRTLTIDRGSVLSIEDVVDFARRKRAGARFSTASAFREDIDRNRTFLDAELGRDKGIYGANTGFGASSGNRLTKEDAETLQKNLIRFHGCGVGPLLDESSCAAALLVRAQCTARCASGASQGLIDALDQFLEHRIIPAIPEIGSVGASGDLTPLSYIAAALAGERRVFHDGRLVESATVLRAKGLKPYTFKAREALAIMNGTSVMSALAALAWTDAERLRQWACRLTGLIVELLDGPASAFLEPLHAVKGHPGEQAAAREICALISHADKRLARDPVTKRPIPGERVSERPIPLQDAYSIRCAPHVIGVLGDVLTWTRELIETELNSVNDNPVILHEQGLILNGGHFFGGHITAACDALKAAVAGVVGLLDRQLCILVDGRFNALLPDNLVARERLGEKAHLHHGFKAAQITLSALSAEAAKATMPTGVFSRSTESHNQDVVSLGTIAARDLGAILQLARPAIAIHAMAVRQGFFVRATKPELNANAQNALTTISRNFEPVIEDRPLESDIAQVADVLFEETPGGHS